MDHNCFTFRVSIPVWWEEKSLEKMKYNFWLKYKCPSISVWPHSRRWRIGNIACWSTGWILAKFGSETLIYNRTLIFVFQAGQAGRPGFYISSLRSRVGWLRLRDSTRLGKLDVNLPDWSGCSSSVPGAVSDILPPSLHATELIYWAGEVSCQWTTVATVAVPARLQVDGKSLEPEAEHTLFSLNILSRQGWAGWWCRANRY